MGFFSKPSGTVEVPYSISETFKLIEAFIQSKASLKPKGERHRYDLGLETIVNSHDAHHYEMSVVENFDSIQQSKFVDDNDRRDGIFDVRIEECTNGSRVVISGSSNIIAKLFLVAWYVFIFSILGLTLFSLFTTSDPSRRSELITALAFIVPIFGGAPLLVVYWPMKIRQNRALYYIQKIELLFTKVDLV